MTKPKMVVLKSGDNRIEIKGCMEGCPFHLDPDPHPSRCLLDPDVCTLIYFPDNCPLFELSVEVIRE